jgi:hypothetical protein
VHEGLGPSRYVTYVIDSQYVLANRRRAASDGDTAGLGALESLSVADIATVTILKASTSSQWSSCEGVPVVLILTKSKQWRPSAQRESP